MKPEEIYKLYDDAEPEADPTLAAQLRTDPELARIFLQTMLALAHRGDPQFVMLSVLFRQRVSEERFLAARTDDAAALEVAGVLLTLMETLKPGTMTEAPAPAAPAKTPRGKPRKVRSA